MTTNNRPPKPQIKMELMFVTPTIALEWLKKNGPNRSIAQNRVISLSSDMTADRFLPTHQGVAFDDKDQLCDGQHRLSAIVSSCRGQWLFVAAGVSSEAMAVLDSGRSRTLADRVTISEGWSGSSHIIPIARLLTENEVGRIYGISDNLIIEMAKREEANIRWIVSKRHPRITSYAPVSAAVAYALPVLGEEKMGTFVDHLISGEMLTQGSPILALRRYLEKSIRHCNKGDMRQGDFRRTLHALHKYFDGAEIIKLNDTEYGVKWIKEARLARGLPVTIE